MAERSPEEFVRAAQIRFALAAEIYERARRLPLGDQYVEMANVAMLVCAYTAPLYENDFSFGSVTISSRAGCPDSTTR